MRAEDVVFWLQNVARQLTLLATAELEQHVRECRESLSHAEDVGCLLDPTAYMKACDSGALEDARHQLAIAEHLLAARKAIDAREQFAATKRGP